LLRYPVWSPPPLPPAPAVIIVPPLASASRLTRWPIPATVRHWRELVEMPETELAKRDIAEVNLACVADLPDAAGVNVRACLDKLDRFADGVRRYTRKCLPHFRAAPEEFENSEAYFRVLCLVTHLQRDLGVRYNPAKVPVDVPLETADVFIHGVLFGDGGTCASIPVVYAAVGRRLGYPIKLVACRTGEVGHLFARWDDPRGERLNIEATNKGLSCLPDEEYRTGRCAVTPEVERDCQLLVSMTPKMELADFLVQRGLLWRHLGRHREAFESFLWAALLHPEAVANGNTRDRTEREWFKGLEARAPVGFPTVQVRHGGRWPEGFERERESRVLLLEATEALLNDAWCEEHWWGPLRRGETVRVPPWAEATFEPSGRAQIRFEWSVNRGIQPRSASCRSTRGLASGCRRTRTVSAPATRTCTGTSAITRRTWWTRAGWHPRRMPSSHQ
jgi:hypothetical protein